MEFDKNRYSSEYNRKNYKGYSFRLNLETEADLIDFLAHRNLKEYVTDLIRKDIRKDQRRKTTIKGSEYKHNHIDQYPFEILEDLPGGDHYTIGYAADLEEAVESIMKYCDQGTPAGMITVLRRQAVMTEHGLIIGAGRLNNEKTEQPAQHERA